MGLVAFLLLLAAAGAPASAKTGAAPSLLCEQAAIVAAGRTGVPISVLKAIMLTETGRAQGDDMSPWPWTVNMEGKGQWFDSRYAATAYAEEHHKRGATSFDVGCFQINYKWHGQNFASLETMFDPMENALYAAGFLAKLFDETNDWETAAGTYHSRTPVYADAYRATFSSIRNRYLTEDALPLPALENADPDWTGRGERAAAERNNSFPLLKAGGAHGLGSLVPMPESGLARSIFALDKAG
ncbi:Transglycosylase SLT domain-containing protein [Maritimibacter sp. HL-12]|nr:Transglycosylase SLT domain-containing protein [Maritimibacter sp. HL-12]